jgi:hypothetical protein
MHAEEQPGKTKPSMTGMHGKEIAGKIYPQKRRMRRTNGDAHLGKLNAIV